jgi:hypothetical protein
VKDCQEGVRILPKTNYIEFGRLMDELNKCIHTICNIEVYRTTRVTVERPARINLSTPSNYKDGSALGARFSNVSN